MLDAFDALAADPMRAARIFRPPASQCLQAEDDSAYEFTLIG